MLQQKSLQSEVIYRKIIVYFLLLAIVLVLTWGCDDGAKQSQIAALKNKLESLRKEMGQVESQLKVAKDKQGFFNSLFSDSPEVKSLKEKMKKLEREIDNTERELAKLEGTDNKSEKWMNLIEILTERFLDRFSNR